MRRLGILLLSVTLLASLAAPVMTADAQEWKGKVPSGANESGRWKELLKELEEEKLYFTLLAAAERVLLYFPDVEMKELAYKIIVRTIARGYPFQLWESFRTADIDPGEKKERFASSYHTYKGILNERLGNERWAESHFRKVDHEGTPAYQFHLAIKAYESKKLDEAVEKLKKVLSLVGDDGDRATAMHAARTLARIYFEQEKYKESLEIYDSFLLRMNPQFFDDWVEAAWNLYYLGDYSKALGYLYNQESSSAAGRINLEKYLLRGLIYKQICAESEIGSLRKAFDQEFGKLVDGIRVGQPLVKFRVLREITTSRSLEYREVRTRLDALRSEARKISALSSRSRAMATVVIKNEIFRLARMESFLLPEQLNLAAEQIVNVQKSLEFLRFEMEREKFKAEDVFKKEDSASGPAPARAESESEKKFDELKISWKQSGDFWRAERLSYLAVIENRCKKRAP